MMIQNEAVGPRFDGILKGTVGFIPDSHALVYAAVRGEKTVVVVDGTQGPEYDGVLHGSLRLNKDGSVHYLAHRAGILYYVSYMK